MSKELKALEKLTNYTCSRMSEKIECKKIIESALNENQERIKELERINKNLVLENRLLNQIDKKKELKLKALEVIKEKRVDTTTLYICFEKKYDLETYNKYVVPRMGELPLTQEEYDLLKEVLL